MTHLGLAWGLGQTERRCFFQDTDGISIEHGMSCDFQFGHVAVVMDDRAQDNLAHRLILAMEGHRLSYSTLVHKAWVNQP